MFPDYNVTYVSHLCHSSTPCSFNRPGFKDQTDSDRYTARVPDNTDMVCNSNTSSLAYQIELQLDRRQLALVPIVQTLSATCVVPNSTQSFESINQGHLQSHTEGSTA
jgi:hypothetical protein